MEWLDRAYDAFSKYHLDTQAAKNGTESVYQDLWKRVVEVVNAANEKGMQLTTNGLPHSRVVAMPFGSALKREMKITLDRDNLLISAESDAGSLSLQIGVEETQVVCLLLNGKVLNGEQAAQKVMEDFLFGGKSPYAIPESLAAQSQAAMRNWGRKLDEDKRQQVPY